MEKNYDPIYVAKLGAAFLVVGIIAVWHSVMLIKNNPMKTGFKAKLLKSYRSFGIVNIIFAILYAISAYLYSRKQ